MQRGVKFSDQIREEKAAYYQRTRDPKKEAEKRERKDATAFRIPLKA
ncbi:MAG: hypothetical protein U5N55_04750 [Cypionkella sp.]|nr:hypothetical protein [Cypionkella sp.]